MLVAGVNGGRDAQPQGVQVEWISDDERLVLPQGIKANAAVHHPIINARWLALLAFHGSFGPGVVTQAQAAAALVASTAAAPSSTPNTNPPVWVGGAVAHPVTRTPEGTVVPAGTAGGVVSNHVVVSLMLDSYVAAAAPIRVRFDVNGSIDSIAGAFATAFGLNYDPRDYQGLGRPDMRMPDSYWQNPANFTLGRMRTKLHGYTMTSIAALNFTRLNGQPLLAWTRSYLVSAGCLHDAASAHNVEFGWTNSRASKATLDLLNGAHRANPDRIMRVAYSIGALFGEEHLARDHTYKQNDAVMTRVNKAYFSALRTVLTSQEQQRLLNDQRHLHRTTCHPFGLAQMYFVALWGAQFSRISEPLAIRATVTPPSIQRVHIVSAAMEQVVALPIGPVIRSAYGNVIKAVNDAKTAIMASPPSFSALHVHYGIANRAKVDDSVLTSAAALMPIVIGFAEAFYIDEKGTGNEVRRGLALAASFSNVKREQSGLVSFFTQLFERYADTALDQGIETYLTKLVKANAGGGAGGSGSAAGGATV